MASYDPEEIRRAFDLIVGDGTTELRAYNANTKSDSYIGTVSGYFDNVESLIGGIDFIRRSPGLYITMNELHPGLITRAKNRVRTLRGKDPATSDVDVTRRKWLLIDCDPIRPSGISASEEEHDAAITRTFDIYDYLRAEGFPDPIIADSGNGGHLLYRIDLPTKDDGLVKGVLEYLSKEYSTNAVGVDTTVFNPSRIVKLYGTRAAKGENSEERPHRMAKIISAPTAPEVVPVEMLEYLAEQGNSTAKAAPALQNKSSYAGNGVFDLDSFFTRNSLDLKDPKDWKTHAGTGRKWEFHTSPMCQHNDGAAWVGEMTIGGPIVAGCQHESCTWGWTELRNKFRHTEPPKEQRQQSSTATTSQPSRVNGKSECPPSPPVPIGSRVRALDRENFGEVVQDLGESCKVHFVSPDGSEATVDLPKADLRFLNGHRCDGVVEVKEIEVIDSDTFFNTDYRQRFLIRNVLVEGQPGIIGGRFKAMKTSVAVDAAISLATGTPFLGEFETIQTPTLVLSGESGKFTLRETAIRVCDSKNISLASAGKNLHWGFDLPQIATLGGQTALVNVITKAGAKVVFIDPAYLCLLSGDTKGLNPSNIFDMGPLLLDVAEVCRSIDCTVVLLHHCKKNGGAEPFMPPELEDLSMAGFAEFARQWILLGRREKYNADGNHRLWMSIGGSAGHSGMYSLDIDEGQQDENFSGRKWDVTVGTVTDAREQAKEEKEARAKERVKKNTDEAKSKVLDALASIPGERCTTRSLRARVGSGPAVVERAIGELLREGAVCECEIEVRGQFREGIQRVRGSKN